MSILDDLAMGFGLKKKDQDYIDRTAKTISKTQGQAAADKYLANNSLIGSNSNVSDFAQSVLDSDDVSVFLPGGDKTGDDLKKFQTI